MQKWIFLVLSILSPLVCATDLPLNQLKLPEGFSATVYAAVPNARSLTLGDNGVVFVGSRDAGKIYALLPNKNKTAAQEVIMLADNLNIPNGVAYHQGSLYVAETHRILRYKDIMQHLKHPNAVAVIVNNLPKQDEHDWRYLRVGPDNKLYFSIGAPCNVCLRDDPRFATIMRANLDGTQVEIYAKGVRNSLGLAWHPTTHELWFTENGRDWLGDDVPPDELNLAPQSGLDFGFPYYFGNNIPDPQFGKLRSAKGLTMPALNLPAHVAPLGMIFYTGKQFPKAYQQQIIIAEHGSWNRSRKVGYRLTLVKLADNKVISYEPFVTGWLQGQTFWGRPVDLLVMPDGALLVSDDYAGLVYRISYGNKTNDVSKKS